MLELLSVIFLVTFISTPTMAGNLKGTLTIDGSSTVAPITEAVAEEFRDEDRRVRISVGISGTGGGFKKFAIGETDINDASRPIKEKEAALAKKNGINFIALPVAFDGISVVTHKQNKITNLSKEDLKKIWTPTKDQQINRWSELDDKYDKQKIKLFGPGPDSGTFDFFTKKILGKTALSRSDYSSSEDDNVIVKGVSSEKYALGYFGYAYYLENKSKLKALSIDGIAPVESSIVAGTYPLARRIYIYVSQKSAQRPEVKKFVNFYLKNAGRLAKEVGYLPLPKKEYAQASKAFVKFSNGAAKGTM